jgi:hypothetical protein
MTWEPLEKQASKLDDALENYTAAPLPPEVKELLEETAKLLHTTAYQWFESHLEEMKEDQ